MQLSVQKFVNKNVHRSLPQKISSARKENNQHSYHRKTEKQV